MTKALLDRLGGNDSLGGTSAQGERHDQPLEDDLHRELEKFRLPLFKGTTKGEVVEAWLENMNYALHYGITQVTRRLGWPSIS
jgi:hypothetical protein